MNDMELVTDVPVLDMEMEVATRNYPVIPNPEGTPTDDISTMEIDNVIYAVKDETARTELDNKVDKVEGKGLSEEDFTHTLKTKLDGIENGAEVNVQSDFAQSDSSADDFIKNKPTKLSDFDNDEGFIDNSVNDLENYYKKSETYTKSEVNSALNGKADKSDTYTKSDVDSALDNKVDKVGGKGLSANDFTDTLKDKLDGIEAEANKTIVDTEISATSTNPLQNKAIYDLLNDLLPEAEETGNPISISNASGFNAKALTVDMLPIQDLHGYDKPWAGGSGVNKYPESAIRGTINSVTLTQNGGNYVLSGTASAYTQFISSEEITLSAGTYTLTEFNWVAGVYVQLRSTDGATTYGSTSSVSSSQFTLTSDTTLKARIVVNNGIATDRIIQIEITEGLTVPSSYSPYSNICPISGRNSLDITVNGNTETINFGETVYGGNTDVVNGGTSVNYDIVDLGTLDWQIDISVPRFLSYSLQNLAKTPASNSQPANIKSPIYETLALGSIYAQGIDSVCALSTGGVVSIVDRRFTTVADFKTAMSGFMLCYELATPTTLTTPATSISLNKGNNTLSTSGDNMDLKYSTTISNPTSLTMARPSLGMIIPTIDSTEDTRLLNNANIEVVEEPTEE